jgi:fumarate reductase subunit D
MARRSLEPLLWISFSAGGVTAALLMPVLVLLFGLAIPLEWVAAPTRAHLLALVGAPFTRLVLFVVFVLSLAHAAHRFRYTLYDGLQIKHLNEMVNLFCYGGAIAVSVWAAYVLWAIP